MMVKRGEIFTVYFGNDVIGSEQGGVRPALIIQNDVGNKYSTTTIVAPITSILQKRKLPTHVDIAMNDENKLTKDSIILLEQIRVIDKKRLREKLGVTDKTTMEKVNIAANISIGTI